jgi:magnesium transporter
MAPNRWEELLEQLRAALEQEHCEPALEALLAGHDPADITLAMEELDTNQAQRVFAALKRDCAAQVLCMTGPELTRDIANMFDGPGLARMIALMPDREAAAVLADQPREAARESVATGAVTRAVAAEARQRAQWPKDSAGRLMTEQFVRLTPQMTCAQALDEVRQTGPVVDLPADLCVVERTQEPDGSRDRLLGVTSLRAVLMAPAQRAVRDIMATELVCIGAEAKNTDAARLLSKHKFSALPVTDEQGYLIGLIPAEDLMQVTLAQLHSRYAKAVGTDAAAMERMSPLQAAVKRVPWLLGTMVIELGAAVVVSHFDATLQKVILLAGFVPVISAVSGNVGLQAVAITVRGLDQGLTPRTGTTALLKEIGTTLFMAIVCGLALGLIGAVWSKHLMFGAVIGLALTCSMLTAAFMGTLFPMVSKRLGFDPATTAGPFETAFQDVIGFGVFLGLATLLASHI